MTTLLKFSRAVDALNRWLGTWIGWMVLVAVLVSAGNAVVRDIVLHVQSGAEPVHALFAIDPKVKISWAHAGMSEPPQVVGELMDRYPQLWTDLSFHAHGIIRDGGIDPTWAALFKRHCDRFTIGTDTYTTSRWDGYRVLIDEHRRWLAHLPANVAEAIAWRNAVRIFGDGGRPRLRPSGVGGDCRPTVELIHPAYRSATRTSVAPAG